VISIYQNQSAIGGKLIYKNIIQYSLPPEGRAVAIAKQRKKDNTGYAHADTFSASARAVVPSGPIPFDLKFRFLRVVFLYPKTENLNLQNIIKYSLPPGGRWHS
jgi:hypothetical protein